MTTEQLLIEAWRRLPEHIAVLSRLDHSNSNG
jgi:hypothetical protein